MDIKKLKEYLDQLATKLEEGDQRYLEMRVKNLIAAFPLVKEFSGYDVSTVVSEGWSGKKNGELLRLAQKKFDVFLPADQNLQYQQNRHSPKL